MSLESHIQTARAKRQRQNITMKSQPVTIIILTDSDDDEVDKEISPKRQKTDATTQTEKIKPPSIFPSHWKQIRKTGYTLQKVDEKIYQNIKGRLDQTISIISIEEVINNHLFRQYKLKKDIMQDVNNGCINEMQLWHGTNEKAVSFICHQSFDPRVVKNGLFGEGAYFSYYPEYSMNLTYSKPGKGGICNIFLADVLVGYSALGTRYIRRPPTRNNGEILYDSCVNSMEWPYIYAIFDRTQAYPRYVIKFKLQT